MKVNDAISGAIFIALAACIFYGTRGFGVLPGQSYGAAFFPRVIAVLMIVCGGWLIFSGVREKLAAPDDKPWAAAMDWMSSPRHVASFVLVLAALLFYILVSDTLGFVLTGFLTLFGLLVWLRGRAHVGSSVVISVIAVLVMQQFFGQFLRVPLPWGVLQAYAW